jgi:hypothetical protein
MAENAPPLWNSPEFEATRQIIMARYECSEEDAIARLQTLWNNADNQRPQSPPPPAPPPAPPPDPVPPLEIEPLALTRKKSVFADFETNTAIPDSLPFFPAPYATDKIKTMEYVELWYFSAEGISDASKIAPTAVDDTFSLLRTELGLAFQQVKAAKASKNVISDEALTWDQILTARHNLLDAAAAWPDKHRVALAEFFMNLEALKATGSNVRTLILYQATARRLWHTALKGPGPCFNLSIINKGLLNQLGDQIRDYDHEELRQASQTFILFFFPYPLAVSHKLN